MAKFRKYGFTLIELIVVIAIIAVLAAILVPSVMGYVKKSKRTADITSAKTIYDTVMAVIADNEEAAESYTSNNNSTQKTVKYNGKAKTYTLFTVCTKDGAANKGGNHSLWSGGSADAKLFQDALNALAGDGKTPIKYNTSATGKPLNRWFVCYRDGDALNTEIWVGDGTTNMPMYRLWPDTDADYK
ncbi:prepilin-type N-terminal cleavage/methylation domain-containing protein [Ruminococcus flavefaciens]|uniref:N-terminal methylation site-containing protein n=1 Tax=Ruminococcus flavefaciens TaxID=1265 RepID=A0A1M7J3I1_RUMFL|nr:prepilin-type N-terminal cleavage/methylation domain-containing protein [Ruminococcus flavefaciens]SHM47584.1 N-terminal methylation site-containing protein [Ruminococcus flavefaciens]